MNLSKLIGYYDSNVNKIHISSEHYDTLLLMRSKLGKGKVENEPHIEGKYYWINDYNNKDNVTYDFYYVNNIVAFRIKFDGKIKYLAHISVICALGRENFGIDVLGGYYIFNNKKIRDVKKIARICSNKLQDNYDCVIEPCPNGLFNECVLLPNKSAIKYTPIKIISRRNNMKTREDYKEYYLEQLIENYGDMTERDYNSAQKFCYDEEWNLGEVGNMAEAIDGLGDAWTEYQKQYKEGFEIMNSKNITSALDYDKIYYNIIETANPYDRTDQWELEKYQSEDRALRKRYPKDEFVKYIDYAAEQMSGDVEQIAKYLKRIGVPNPHGQNGYIAMYTFNNLTGSEYSTRFEDWMNAVRWKDISIEEMAQEIYNAIHNIKSSKQSVKSSKFVDENNPDNPISSEEMKEYVQEWVDNGEFKKLFEYDGESDEESYNKYFDE